MAKDAMLKAKSRRVVGGRVGWAMMAMMGRLPRRARAMIACSDERKRRGLEK